MVKIFNAEKKSHFHPLANSNSTLLISINVLCLSLANFLFPRAAFGTTLCTCMNHRWLARFFYNNGPKIMNQKLICI